MDKTPEDVYLCGYCRARLDYGAEATLRHVVRHLGQDRYLASYHRYLERCGYDELSAHLLTIADARKLARA